MKKHHPLDNSYEARLAANLKSMRWSKLHLDPLMLLLIVLLASLGLIILYSAGNQSSLLIRSQVVHLLVGAACMFAVAQIPPYRIRSVTPWLFFAATILLMLVPILGHQSQGARRWLGIGAFQIQPSEIIKLAMPMMLAWLFHHSDAPNSSRTWLIGGLLFTVPLALVIKQPDLGTGILIGISGVFVFLLAGISWRIIAAIFVLALAATPLAWHFMHHYQKLRILNLINPERDPLGSGYNIIQSKIAVGSGGLIGKGWLLGTQSHLAFLPTHTTDFIFAVYAEEFGLIGCLVLFAILLCLFFRSLMISLQAQSEYDRLLAGSLSFTFLMNAFINIAMVIGLLPVVGVPLPLVSYGGSTIVTSMIGFGILMSIHTNRKLWST